MNLININLITERFIIMSTLPMPTNPYPNCYLVNVTPEMARHWLRNNNFNRPLNQRLVEKYARQMRTGNWQRTHQGIAFDSRGVVLDGQHRLWAIIRSGHAIPMLIFLNENFHVHESIDGGKTRSLLDVVRLEIRDNTLKNRHIYVVKAMWAGRHCVNQNDMTATEVSNLLRNFHLPVRFAVELLEHSHVADNVVMSVIARAYQSVPQERLIKFCNILRNGEGSHPSATMILQFRDWLLRLKDRQAATRRDIYKRTEIVLNAFLNNAVTCDLFSDYKELFPLYGHAE
jgi:hypothetical protein